MYEYMTFDGSIVLPSAVKAGHISHLKSCISHLPVLYNSNTQMVFIIHFKTLSHACKCYLTSYLCFDLVAGFMRTQNLI